MLKNKIDFLEDCGFDVEAFKLENEYSFRNLMEAMDCYAQQAFTMAKLKNYCGGGSYKEVYIDFNDYNETIKKIT